CYNGYTVVTPFLSPLIYLVDMLGRVVHQWEVKTDPQLYAEVLERQIDGSWLGVLWRDPGSVDPRGVGETAVGQCAVVNLDPQSNIVWRWDAPEGFWPHHDVRRLKSGNTLLLLNTLVDMPEIAAKPLLDQYFQEIKPDGTVVWEWRTSDHFEEFGFSAEARRIIHERGGDVFHNNTASVLPGNRLGAKDRRFRKGNILGSQRHTSIIYIIDRDSGEVVWKWGDGPGQLVGQHHPTMQENGNILIYDNGGRSRYPSVNRFYTRLIEINPATGEVAWEYQHEPLNRKETCKFFSPSWGSAQRLPNGNTFSLDCHKGRLFEVTPDGEIVWEYISPFPWGARTKIEYGIYRSFRFGYDMAPFVNPHFRKTDGHKGVAAVKPDLPENLGLPSNDLP
ncbi:MAG: aryl-sulfate sulfotransferase, partial [Candidatus Sumerlaeota bacterium]|nr:aryl-sulfate sulfotransferase [Candidatus Sumerlaeota bacterium]